jgi:putative flippase GtrA
LRYCGASAVSTAVGLTVLTALVATSTTSAAVANLIATAVGTIPSFELNRRWVWNHRDRRSLRRQVIPFCIMSFLSLGLSTLAVAAAASWASDSGLGSGARAVISDGASLAAFGAMWVVQYLVLDRVLFASGSGRGAVGTRAGTGLP